MNSYYQMLQYLVIYSAMHRTIGAGGDTRSVGFDPQRLHRRRPSDLVFVAAGLLLTVLAVVWALFG